DEQLEQPDTLTPIWIEFLPASYRPRFENLNEYRAKAAMLDKEYDVNTHAFHDTTWPQEQNPIDADTLRVMTWAEENRRRTAFLDSVNDARVKYEQFLEGERARREKEICKMARKA